MNVIKGKCGTDCNTCQFKEKFHCGGCEKMHGKIFWGECDIYKCAANKGFHHCGDCQELPCKDLIQFIENGHNPDRLTNLNMWKNENSIIDSRCGLHCFHGECPVAICCQNKGIIHCGECPDIPCELLTQYSCDPEHGDTPQGARIKQCKRWYTKAKGVQ